MTNRFAPLVPLAFYTLLAIIILYPIITHTGTHAAGFDYFNYHWNFWWIRHSLTMPNLSVFATDFTFFPFMNNLGYHAFTTFWYPVWALLEPLTGTLPAMTVIIVLGAILNGWLLYLWLRKLNIAPVLALIGGMVLQCTPLVRYFYYNTHINLMDWFWLPAHLLLWQQIVTVAEKRHWRQLVLWAGIEGLALYGLALTDHQFPIFTAFLLVPYGLLTLWRSSQKIALIGAGLLAVTITITLLWFAGPLPAMLEFSGTLAPGPVDERPGVPFPRGYFSVDAVWWEWNTPTLGGFAMITMLISLAVSVSPLGKYLPRDRWFWFAVMIPPLLLSIGPDIVLFGQTIPMPYRVLHALTNGMLRMPWRLAPIFIIAAMIFVGLTWTPLLNEKYSTQRHRDAKGNDESIKVNTIYQNTSNRVFDPALTTQHSPPISYRQRLIFIPLFILLAIDARIWQTGPLRPVLYPYEFYETIGAEKGTSYDELVVLEVPTGIGTGEVLIGDERAITLQMYSMTHEKRGVNGFISRAPTEHFWYLNTDDPMLSWLGQRRFLEPEAVEAQLRERIFKWPIGYIIVHQDLIGRVGPTAQEIIGYLNSLDNLLCPVWVEGDAVVYRTAAHPDGCPGRIPDETMPGVYAIDIGADGDEQHIGWGWHWPESIFDVTLRWAGVDSQTTFYADLPPGDYTVTITAQAFWETRALQLLVNDTALGDPVNVAPDVLQNLTFDLPADRVGGGKHLTFTLVYDEVVVPVAVGQSADERPLAIAVDRIEFERNES